MNSAAPTTTGSRNNDPPAGNHSLRDRLPREAVALLLCAGPATNDRELQQVLTEPLDWISLRWLADEERAASIFWRRVNQVNPEAVPATERPALQRSAMLSDFSAMYLEERTGVTLHELERAGISPTLLKGAALARTAFDGFIDRPMSDVDLLVEPANAHKAWEIAQSTGWVWDAERYPAAHYEGHHHLPPLLGRYGTDTKLEIHTALFVEGHPFRFGVGDLADGAREAIVGGARTRVPGPHALLMHVALHHAWSHMMAFGGWRALRDVSALCEVELDWGRFLALAADVRAAPGCYWMLRLSRELVGARVPPEVLDELAQAVRLPLGTYVERHFARDLFPLAGGCPSSRMSRWMWTLAMQPRRSQHGSTRPWLLEDPPSHSLESPTMGDEVVSFARQLARFGDWWRYTRGLLR
ncbi:MAG: nucleotidyltransferase family protein [Gemmatimonadota bacterium]